MRDNSVPYTLSGPGGVVVFDPVDPNSRMWVEDCTFNSGIRSEISDRPQAHGSYIDPGFKGGGVWASTVRIIGGGLTLETQRTRVVKVLNSLLGDSGGGTLRWCNQGSSTPQRLSNVRLLDENFKIDGGTLLAMMQLGSEKPFAEDETAVLADSAPLTASGGGFTIPLVVPFTLTPSSGGNLTVTNNGDFYAYPVLRIYGPIVAPRLTNVTLVKSLVWTGSIADGDYWEVDLFAKTVKLNGVTSVTSMDVASSDWFKCGIGDTILQLFGYNYSTSTFLRAYMRSSWG